MFSKVWIFRFRDLHRMESDDSLLSDLIDTHTVLPRMIAGGEYSFFGTKRGRLFEEDDYFKYCSLEVLLYNVA